MQQVPRPAIESAVERVKMRFCRYCGRCSGKLRKCAVCEFSFGVGWYYCGSACQKSEWPLHRRYHVCLSADEAPKKLFWLASEGDWVGLSNLHLSKHELMSSDGSGYSLLHIASFFGKTEFASNLVEIVTRDGVMARSAYGETALHVACKCGHLDLAKVLHSVGGKDLVIAVDQEKKSCAHYAAREGREDILKWLLMGKVGGMDLLMVSSSLGLNCLHEATTNGHLGAVKLIVASCTRLIQPLSRNPKAETYVCVTTENWEVPRTIIEEGAQCFMCQRDCMGRTALNLAIIEGHMEIAKYLATVGGPALVSVESPSVYNSLHMAARFDNAELVKHLLRIEPRILYTLNDRKGTAIHVAAQRGQLAALKALLDALGKNKDLLKQRDTMGLSPLDESCLAGQIDSVRVLLHRGGRQQLSDPTGSPLMRAIDSQRFDLVRLMVEEGGMDLLRRRGARDSSCLHYAAEVTGPEIVSYLVDQADDELFAHINSDGVHCFHVALRFGRLESAQLMFKRADPKVFHMPMLLRDGRMGTCLASLFMSASSGSVETVRWVCSQLTRQEVISARTNRGSTVVNIAAQSGHPNSHLVIEDLLATYGRELLVTDGGGWSALHAAASTKGAIKSVRLLAEAFGGMLLEVRSRDDGLTPLHSAAQVGDAEVVRYLATARGGVLLFVHAARHVSSLHFAALHGHLEAARVLVDLGGKAMALHRSDDGTAAIHLAALKGSRDICMMMLKVGGEAQLRWEGQGQMPWQAAMEKGNVELAKELARMVGIILNVEGTPVASASR